MKAEVIKNLFCYKFKLSKKLVENYGRKTLLTIFFNIPRNKNLIFGNFKKML